jgi:urease accessory protein
MTQRFYLAIITLFVLGQPAMAAGSAKSIISGLLHPVLGFDHLMAMIAVGLLSVQHKGRHIFRLPACFVIVLFLGAVIGLASWPLPHVEGIISMSVLILGLAIASGGRLALVLAYPIVAVFALFHGHAHGAEIPSLGSPVAFIAGFLIASAILHLLGVSIGSIARNPDKRALLGAGCAGVGLHMVLLTYGLV